MRKSHIGTNILRSLVLIVLLLIALPMVYPTEINYDIKALYCQNKDFGMAECLKYWETEQPESTLCPESPEGYWESNYAPDNYNPDCLKSMEWRTMEHEFEIEKMKLDKGFTTLDCPKNSCPDPVVCVECYTEEECRSDIVEAVGRENQRWKDKEPWFFKFVAIFILVGIIGGIAYSYYKKVYLKKHDHNAPPRVIPEDEKFIQKELVPDEFENQGENY